MHKHYLVLPFPFLCLLTADVNECMEGTHDCHPQATCQNAEGSFTCSCNPGFTGNGSSCTGKSSINLFLQPAMHKHYKALEYMI